MLSAGPSAGSIAESVASADLASSAVALGEPSGAEYVQAAIRTATVVVRTPRQYPEAAQQLNACLAPYLSTHDARMQ